MKAKQGSLYSLLIFIVIFLMDFLSKNYAVKNFKVIYNKGVAFGLFENLPQSFQTLSLCIAFSLFLFIFVLFLSFLPRTLNSLKYASSAFTGGALGNVIDRLLDGKTVDFIPLSSGYFFNIADIFLIAGFLLCIYQFTKHRNTIWFPQDVRKKYYVDKQFQLSFLYRMVFIGVMISSVFFAFNFIFLWMTLDLMDLPISKEILTNFAFSYLSLTIILIIILTGFSLVFSHRIVGPLFALKRFINNKEKSSSFSLRKGDEMQNITNKIVEDIYNQYKKEDL